MLKKMKALRKIGKKKQKQQPHSPASPDPPQTPPTGGDVRRGQRQRREHAQKHQPAPGTEETKEVSEGFRFREAAGDGRGPREGETKASPGKGRKEDQQEYKGRTDEEKNVRERGADADQREKLQLPDTHQNTGTAPSSPPELLENEKVETNLYERAVGSTSLGVQGSPEKDDAEAVGCGGDEASPRSTIVEEPLKNQAGAVHSEAGVSPASVTAQAETARIEGTTSSAFFGKDETLEEEPADTLQSESATSPAVLSKFQTLPEKEQAEAAHSEDVMSRTLLTRQESPEKEQAEANQTEEITSPPLPSRERPPEKEQAESTQREDIARPALPDKEEPPEKEQAIRVQTQAVMSAAIPTAEEPPEKEQTEAVHSEGVTSPTSPNREAAGLNKESPEKEIAEAIQTEEVASPVLLSRKNSPEKEHAEAVRSEHVISPTSLFKDFEEEKEQAKEEEEQAEAAQREDVVSPVLPSVESPLETQQADAFHGEPVASPAGKGSEAQDTIGRSASGVKVPAAAPFIQDWYIQREAVIAATCQRLGVGEGRGIGDQDGRATAEEPPVVGLAGPAGAGKSIAASMVIARSDVRAHFSSTGVVWLPVGQGAKERIPELMHRLAVLAHELLASKSSADGRDCRPPRTPDIGVDPEDGAAYVREVIGGDGDDDSSSRGGRGVGALLVVADDVWEADVLEELRRTGASILYTTPSGDLLAGDDGVLPLRVDDLTEGEAEALLRRAAELEDGAALPDSALEMMRRGGLAAMDLACVGRWDSLRKTNDEAAWATALSTIADAQRFMDGAALLPWRSAVLLAGLEQLTLADERNKELYLSLAVLPSDLSVSVDDLTVLLTGDGEAESPGQDLQAARRVVETLEMWSVLVREVGGRYRVRGSHTDVAWQAVSDCPDILDRALTRWRKHVSSADAVFAWRVEELVDIWLTMSSLESDQDGEEMPGPYRAIVDAVDPSDPRARELLRRIALFEWSMQDCDAAYETWTKLLALDDEGERASQDQEVDDEFPHVGVTMYTLGVHALGSGRAEEAERWFRKALSFEEKTLGADDLSLADTLHQIASSAFLGGRAEEAELLHLRALGIREESQGHEHPDVAKTLHALGLCVLRVGRTKEAEGYLRRALRIYFDHPTDSRMPRTLYDLGRCLAVAGKTREAEEYFHRALFMQEKTQGFSSLPVADTLYALGGCMADAGRTASAEAFYRRALAIREASLGVLDSATARAVRALGHVLLDAGNAEEAEALFLKGLAHVEQVLGGWHPVVADTLHSLGECALALERPDEASGRLRRALAIRQEALGGDHVVVADTLYDMGRCASQLGRAEEAEELFAEALGVKETALGEHHEEVPIILYSLAMSVAKQGARREEVEGLLQRALEVEREAQRKSDPGGPDSEGVGDIVYGLGECFFEAGRLKDASTQYRQALTIYEKAVGDHHVGTHPKVLFVLHALGRCLLKAGRAEEAEVSFRRVLMATASDDEEGVDGARNLHPLVSSTYGLLSRCAMEEGRTEEALGLQRCALEIRQENLGPDHLQVSLSLYGLGRIFFDDGRLFEAQQCLDRALTIQEAQLDDGHPDLAATLAGLEDIRRRRQFFY